MTVMGMEFLCGIVSGYTFSRECTENHATVSLKR